MKYKKKIIVLSLISIFIASIVVFSFSNKPNNFSKTYAIIKDNKFGSIYLNVSNEKFIDDGFSLGDSLNVVFSNGYSLNDLPFYSGYYVRTGHNLVVAYPGYEYIAIAKSSDEIWDEVGANEGSTCTVSINEKGKFLSVQEALSQTYSNSRDDFDSDIMFSNFRCLRGGKIKDNTFYRGASPFNNEKNRAFIVDQCIKEKGIKFILDLSDSQEDISKYFNDINFKSNYAKELYKKDNVALLNLSAAYTRDTYKQSLANGLRIMLNKEKPVYIHCVEGKDRTGFICILLEGLAGATYDELLLDYMTTYENYFGITKENNPDKYIAIVDVYFNAFINYLLNTDDKSKYSDVDFVEPCKNYLLSSGLTEEEIFELTKYICE